MLRLLRLLPVCLVFAAAASPPAKADDAVPALTFACGDVCKAANAKLAADDAAELGRLPGQVKATVDATYDRSTLPSVPAATDIATQLLRGRFDGDFTGIKPGVHTCTVYWFGFLDNASERVGMHKCTVARRGGALTVEKTTGDGFAARLVPYAGGIEAVIGRTYLPGGRTRAYDRAHPADASNRNYGDKVGLALADKGRLFLVSINERGFTEPDDTFFEVIAVE